MHTIRLLLKTTEYDCQQMERRFHAVSHIHNVCVKRCIHLMQQLRHHAEYQAVYQQYVELLDKPNLSAEGKKRKTALSKEMASIRKDLGLTEYALQSYMTVCAKQYRKLLSSQQIQKEVSRVWSGVEKVLFGKGEKLHFKKYMDFDTISGKSNTNGVKFDKDTLSIRWLGLSIPCKLPKGEKDLAYLKESLDADISYCDIKRMMFPNGWHYYVIICLKGDAPKKLIQAGDAVMGIDPGVSTLAGVSDTVLFLEELAPRTKEYNTQIQKVQQHLDASRRAMNPEKYRKDGTVIKQNRSPWIYSASYRKNQRKLKSLYRRKSAYIKQSHEELCNRLLTEANTFLAEDMAYAGLQKRSKRTMRREKEDLIRKKDGSIQTVHKFRRKKRFGSSMNNRAPSLFLSILERKCTCYGGVFLTVNTRTFRASQYDHMTDTYTPAPLAQRMKPIGGIPVQRDLYSAFLIRNADRDLTHADREQCLKKFDSFVKMQSELIDQMKESGISMKQCFGF